MISLRACGPARPAVKVEKEDQGVSLSPHSPSWSPSPLITSTHVTVGAVQGLEWIAVLALSSLHTSMLVVVWRMHCRLHGSQPAAWAISFVKPAHEYVGFVKPAHEYAGSCKAHALKAACDATAKAL